ncbi:MAG: folylpolyglutamate synthase/dihydrofolate synthase family protein [Candidatus Binatia bacterium]
MSTYKQTLDFVYRLEVEQMNLKLERVAEALRLCGSPQERFPILHVAGTNGKGSTALFLYAMLSAAGYRVGLFTSPHLIDFCERIRLGQTWITEQEVIDGVEMIRALVEPVGVQLTPFEMMTVLALHAFAQAQVDIAVVEVGLGGRLDATNVVTPLVSVITSIGLDHQAYLGSTVPDIAREKGGIIKPSVPVVIGRVTDESEQVLSSIARTCNSTTYMLGRDFAVQEWYDGQVHYHGLHWQFPRLQLGLRGRFQCDNVALALAALEVCLDEVSITEEQARCGIAAARWPGRLDVVSQQPLVILDGAHNPQAMETLVRELPRLLNGRRAKLLFAAMRDKDWQTMIASLVPLASEVVVTRVQQSRAENPAAFVEAFRPFCPVQVIEDAQTACSHLMAGVASDEAILVTGSLFLVGEVYALFSSTAMVPLALADCSKGQSA